MKRIELVRLQPKFSHLVSAYLQGNKLTQAQLAERVGIQRGHLNELITSQSRKLSAYYLMRFIQKGIIKVSEINDGMPENEREMQFWDQASEVENYDTLKKIAEFRKMGGNVDDVLNAAIAALRDGKA